MPPLELAELNLAQLRAYKPPTPTDRRQQRENIEQVEAWIAKRRQSCDR